MLSFEYKLISLVLLHSDLVPESQAPVTRDANLFDILKGNRIMTDINSELVLIMIATEGMDFYAAKKAADHIANIIATKDLIERNLGVSRRTHCLGRCVVERSN